MSDCSAFEPPAKAAISTSSPSSAKYLRCCAMISGRYGRPSDAVAIFTLRFSGACALAVGAANVAIAADRMMMIAIRRVAGMTFLRAALCGRLEASVGKTAVCCQALFGHGTNAHPGTDR